MIALLRRWLSKLRKHEPAPEPLEQFTLTCDSPRRLIWQYSIDGKVWITMNGNSFVPTERGMYRIRGKYVEGEEAT